MDTRRPGSNSKGMSLIELLITVVVIGVLAAVAIPTYTGYVTKAEERRIIKKLEEARFGMETIRTRTNSYPSAVGDLTALVDPGPYTLTIVSSGRTFFLVQADATIRGQAQQWTINQDGLVDRLND